MGSGSCALLAYIPEPALSPAEKGAPASTAALTAASSMVRASAWETVTGCSVCGSARRRPCSRTRTRTERSASQFALTTAAQKTSWDGTGRQALTSFTVFEPAGQMAMARRTPSTSALVPLIASRADSDVKSSPFLPFDI